MTSVANEEKLHVGISKNAQRGVSPAAFIRRREVMDSSILFVGSFVILAN